MTLITEHTPVASWAEPDGIAPRGTLIVIPGRGEQPELYERFGRRIAGDGYRCTLSRIPSRTLRSPRPRCWARLPWYARTCLSDRTPARCSPQD